MSFESKTLCAFFSIVFILCGYAIYRDATTKTICDYSEIAEIIQAHHRSVTVRLINGTVIEINQPQHPISKGSKIPFNCKYHQPK